MRILPSDVRYALRYRRAMMGIPEIRDLALNGFEREALYLTFKAVERYPETQLCLMRSLAETLHDVRDESGVQECLREFAEACLRNLPKDCAVLGTKLAQLSRQGFDLWKQRYEESADRHAEDDTATFLIGHATFVGLPEFVMAHQKAAKVLYILIPSLTENVSRRMCGYRIDGARAEYLPKKFDIPEQAMVVDDTRRTGNGMKKIESFWLERGHTPPRFEFLDIVA